MHTDCGQGACEQAAESWAEPSEQWAGLTRPGSWQLSPLLAALTGHSFTSHSGLAMGPVTVSKDKGENDWMQWDTDNFHHTFWCYPVV